MDAKIIYMNPDNIYILQDRFYGLGNFINLTPTIKLMADHFGDRIPVYFDLKFIEECFLDCEFIEILKEKPKKKEKFGSWLTNARWNNCPDYIYVHKFICQSIPLVGELPHTYVDRCEEIEAPKYNTLFIRGSGSERKDYLDSKMPEDGYYHWYFADTLAGDYTEAFTGSENDIKRSNGLFDGMTKYVGGIRMALALIREADFIVANDSGLAHAAAAMNKPMTILWKNTSLPKNASPGKRTKYQMCH